LGAQKKGVSFKGKGAEEAESGGRHGPRGSSKIKNVIEREHEQKLLKSPKIKKEKKREGGSKGKAPFRKSWVGDEEENAEQKRNRKQERSWLVVACFKGAS